MKQNASGRVGSYWSSSLYSKSPYSAYHVYFNASSIFNDEDSYRHYGYSVRAAGDKELQLTNAQFRALMDFNNNASHL